MKRRRKKHSNVRWLAGPSFMSTVDARAISAPATILPTVQYDLILDTNADALPVALSASQSRRADVDNLILDHISGKVHWGFEGNDGLEGAQDATGTWVHMVRAAIVILPTATDATANVEELQGSTSLQSIDPGANIPWVIQGSWVPDGVRPLWRRSWFVVNAWSADESDAWFGSENMCPPGPWVDIKPKRLLKANDRLKLLVQCTTLGGAGAQGTLRFWSSHDLRVAAHNTQRRR